MTGPGRRRFIGYKIVDELEGCVPDTLDETSLITDIEILNRFFNAYEYEAQWVVVPVYHDRRPGDPDDPCGYRLFSREEAEALIPETDKPGRQLLGYQIVSRAEFLPPDTIGENEIFTSLALLNRFFLDLEQEEQRWIIVPVYKGDIEHPEVVTDLF